MATFPDGVVAALVAVATRVGDVVLAPLVALPPLAGLAVASAATALVTLLVARRVSDQAGITRAKRQIAAALLEIRLFNAEPAVVARAVGRALRHNLAYLLRSLVPLVWLAVPLGLAVAQLQAFYGYDGLQPGAPTLLRVQLAASVPGTASVRLAVPPGVDVDSAAVRLGGDEVLWRLVPRTPGRYVLRVHVDAAVADKTLTVGTGPARRSPVRPTAGVWAPLQWPSEPPLADGPVRAISVTYPDAELAVPFGHASWLTVYVVLTLAFAVAMAPRLGVVL